MTTPDDLKAMPTETLLLHASHVLEEQRDHWKARAERAEDALRAMRKAFRCSQCVLPTDDVTAVERMADAVLAGGDAHEATADKVDAILGPMGIHVDREKMRDLYRRHGPPCPTCLDLHSVLDHDGAAFVPCPDCAKARR